MEHCQEIGLAKRIGVSNWSIAMLEKFRFNPDIKIQPYANQVEFHLYMQQEPLRGYLKQRGIIMEGYSTLGTADWRKEGEPDLLKDEVLNQIAKELGQTAANVEFKFLEQLNPGVVLLAKSVTPERIKANIAPRNFTLSAEQMERLKKREKCYRFVDVRKLWKWEVQGEGW
jgi:diketogulonate reductase-like aldo/keto reductase